LAPHIEAALWRADQLGTSTSATLSSGFASLDAELPGNGWPCQSLTELLQPQPTVAEWRLLGAAMHSVVASGRDIVVIGPPKSPHLPGLRHLGVDERHLVWLQPDGPAERLWVTEQVIRANAAGLLVSWLPQARQEQIRRLQIGAQGCDGPVFLCRPAAALHEPSAAPLRLHLRTGPDWELQVQIVKRKGPTHEGSLHLTSVPGGLESILTPRLAKPSTLLANRQLRDAADVVGRPAPRHATPRPVATIPAH
jgi:protein ImuA